MSNSNLRRLLEIMAHLRDPGRGCPWDLEQSFATIAPYTIEEAYEVAEAAETGNTTSLKEELGDLLLQVVFHARIAEERGHFSFEDVAGVIAEKMVRRHPHLFAGATLEITEAQTGTWEELKAAERRDKALSEGRQESALDGVGIVFPALTRAEKLQKRAARVGFDWVNTPEIFEKITEEIDELRTEIEIGTSKLRMQEEFGDLLFAVVNLARRLEIDPEQALRYGNRKFERRFRLVEELFAARGKSLSEATLREMDEAWQAIKETERKTSNS